MGEWGWGILEAVARSPSAGSPACISLQGGFHLLSRSLVSWMELVSTLPEHRVWGKPSSPSANVKPNTLGMFLPSSHQISPQRMATRLCGTQESAIFFFWSLYFPPTSIDRQCTFEMVSQGSENLICHPILTSRSLISYVLGQILQICTQANSVLSFVFLCPPEQKELPSGCSIPIIKHPQNPLVSPLQTPYLLSCQSI